MRIVNMAHGSYFMLGGYVGLSVVWRTGSFAAALLAGALALALVGVGMERFFLRRLPGQTLGQALMTIGFALIFQDLALLIWGGDPYSIHVPRISFAVFALGAALAALGGVIGAGFLGVYPGADFEVLPYAFVVVIVGGLGSLPGAMVGSLLVGLLDNFGKALFPELSYFTLFAPMALILAIRPTGLFGRG